MALFNFLFFSRGILRIMMDLIIPHDEWPPAHPRMMMATDHGVNPWVSFQVPRGTRLKLSLGGMHFLGTALCDAFTLHQKVDVIELKVYLLARPYRYCEEH